MVCSSTGRAPDCYSGEFQVRSLAGQPRRTPDADPTSLPGMEDSPLFNAVCLDGDGYYWRSPSLDRLEHAAEFHEAAFPSHVVKVFYPPAPSWPEIKARHDIRRSG